MQAAAQHELPYLMTSGIMLAGEDDTSSKLNGIVDASFFESTPSHASLEIGHEFINGDSLKQQVEKAVGSFKRRNKSSSHHHKKQHSAKYSGKLNGKFPTLVTHQEILESKVNEPKAMVKFQLKKVICIGRAMGNVSMEEKQIFQNVQLSVNFLVSLLKKNWQNVIQVGGEEVRGGESEGERQKGRQEIRSGSFHRETRSGWLILCVYTYLYPVGIINRVGGKQELAVWLETKIFTREHLEETTEAYDTAAIKFRGANTVINFEMNRYDVQAIMKSSLRVGGAAKCLKVSLKSKQKALPVSSRIHNVET